jgi:hypothetical protein
MQRICNVPNLIHARTEPFTYYSSEMCTLCRCALCVGAVVVQSYRLVAVHLIWHKVLLNLLALQLEHGTLRSQRILWYG